MDCDVRYAYVRKSVILSCQYPNAIFNLVHIADTYLIANVTECTKFLNSFLSGINGGLLVID